MNRTLQILPWKHLRRASYFFGIVAVSALAVLLAQHLLTNVSAISGRQAEAASATQSQEPAADPESVVRAMYDAMNSWDANAAGRYFDDNAIYVRPPYSGSCARQSPCIGRSAIVDRFGAEATNHRCITVTSVDTDGSAVIARVEVRNDSTRARGIERNSDIDLVEVSEGKVLALYQLPNLADPQTAASDAIGAGRQAPGAPIPNPGTPCV